MGAPDPIQLFGLGTQEKSAPAMAQRRVNLYYELQSDPDRARMVAYKTPGLDSPFINFGDTAVRGVIWPPEQDYCFFVHRFTFWQVDNTGTAVDRGLLTTATGKVSMAHNGRYIGIVDGVVGYYYDMQNAAAGIQPIVDADFPNGAHTISWQGGFFLAEFEDQLYQSDYGSVSSWPGDFGVAESNPDTIIRHIADEDDLKIFGSQSLEFWANTGAADFSFERIPGTTQKVGLAARDSVASFDDSFAFLAKNRERQVFAAVLRGYKPDRISNHDLEAKWRAYGTFSDAVAGSYMLDGHPMYVVSFPTGGETWMYDGSTSAWTQLKGYGLTRHRGELYFNYLGQNYVTDFENGNVYPLDPEVFTDDGDPIVWLLSGRHVAEGFSKMGIDSFQLDIETGVGLTTGQGSDPQVMLRISRDGGRTFGNERWRTIGAKGKYKTRVIWRKCGRGRDFVFELSGSDPVKTAILGAGIQPRGASS